MQSCRERRVGAVKKKEVLGVFAVFGIGALEFLITFLLYNDYLMAKSQKAFRRAALRRSKTAGLFCQIILAMSIGRMIQRIIRCQTCRLAAKTIDSSIVFAIR